jgi:RNA polymerase sigma factor (sigma-70 family)
MATIPDNNSGETVQLPCGVGVPTSEVEAWFVREILPLEASLVRFLQSSYRNTTDISDLRQEVYANVITAARQAIPTRSKAFLFTTARNLLINRVRHERIISIETVSDLDELNLVADEPSQERAIIARDELRRVRAAIEQLPPKCRETILLRRVEGLSGREIALRMGISESAVSHYVDNGMRSLAELLFAESTDRRKQS